MSFPAVVCLQGWLRTEERVEPSGAGREVTFIDDTSRVASEKGQVVFVSPLVPWGRYHTKGTHLKSGLGLYFGDQIHLLFTSLSSKQSPDIHTYDHGVFLS